MSKHKWIDGALSGQRCVQCDRRLEDAEIHAVGVARGGEFKNEYGEPTSMVIAQCRACGRRNLTLGILPPGPDLEAYIRRFISRAWGRAAFYKPPRKSKRSGGHQDVSKSPPGSSNDTPEFDQSDTGDQPSNSSVVRPSIRRGTSKKPISVEEQRRFVRRLHRTSFNPSTKIFKAWLRRLTG